VRARLAALVRHGVEPEPFPLTTDPDPDPDH
jgi:hypothetical protein